MKIKNILLGIHVFILITSCDLLFQHKIETKRLDNFNVKLSDDVSPLEIQLSVNGKWGWTKWTLNNKNQSLKLDNQSGIIYGKEKGTYLLIFEGYKNDTKYFGEKTIEIPPVATKIKMVGFCFGSSDTEIYFEDKKYKIKFSYYDSQKYIESETYINFSGVSVRDTVFIESPVEFNIRGFTDGDKANSTFTNVRIIDEDKNYINQTRGNHNFFLSTTYLSDRLIFGKIQIVTENDNSLYLIADWMP